MKLLTFLLFSCLLAASTPLRFRLHEAQSPYSVKLGGYIHQEPWVLPKKAQAANLAYWPPENDHVEAARLLRFQHRLS